MLKSLIIFYGRFYTAIVFCLVANGCGYNAGWDEMREYVCDDERNALTLTLTHTSTLTPTLTLMTAVNRDSFTTPARSQFNKCNVGALYMYIVRYN